MLCWKKILNSGYLKHCFQHFETKILLLIISYNFVTFALHIYFIIRNAGLLHTWFPTVPAGQQMLKFYCRLGLYDVPWVMLPWSNNQIHISEFKCHSLIFYCFLLFAEKCSLFKLLFSQIPTSQFGQVKSKLVGILARPLKKHPTHFILYFIFS